MTSQELTLIKNNAYSKKKSRSLWTFMSESKPQKDEYKTNKQTIKKPSTMAGKWGRLNSILHTTPLRGFCNRKRWCNRKLLEGNLKDEEAFLLSVYTKSSSLCLFHLLCMGEKPPHAKVSNKTGLSVQRVSAVPRVLSLFCGRTEIFCVLPGTNKPLLKVFQSQERRQQNSYYWLSTDLPHSFSSDEGNIQLSFLFHWKKRLERIKLVQVAVNFIDSKSLMLYSICV